MQEKMSRALQPERLCRIGENHNKEPLRPLCYCTLQRSSCWYFTLILEISKLLGLLILNAFTSAGGVLTDGLIAEHLNRCSEPCTASLACHHQCRGTCGACFNGRVHRACQENCGRTLVCGHRYYLIPTYL